MSDSETREVLIVLCEAVKAEYRHLWGLQSDMARTFQALKAEIPGLAARYEAQGIVIQEFPDIRAWLERVDALLQQLKKV